MLYVFSVLETLLSIDQPLVLLDLFFNDNDEMYSNNFYLKLSSPLLPYCQMILRILSLST